MVTRNSSGLRDVILGLLSPIKTNYNSISEELKSAGDSYIFQKETIKRLSKENRVLRRYLLEQTNYLRQLAVVYSKIPSLKKLPYKSVVLVDTISYVKLNKFDEILLTMPKKSKLDTGRSYGLIQDEVVAGVAKVINGQLYGYLTSNPMCKFSVYVGPKKMPGIAFGKDKTHMEVKFIPKWAKIEKGDIVETNGLDKMFFANIPVGVVERVEIEASYKKAIITTYSDTMHPGLFFLITDATPYLSSYYDQNSSFSDEEYIYDEQPKPNDRNLSSIPETIQTKDMEVDPGEFEIPHEEPKPKPTPATVEKPKSISVTVEKSKPVKPFVVKKPKSAIRPKLKKKKKKSIKPKTKLIKQRPVLNPKPVETPKPILKDQKRTKEKKKRPSPFDILKMNLY